MTRHSFIIGCCHKTYFTNPILIHMRFSFVSVYINLTRLGCDWERTEKESMSTEWLKSCNAAFSSRCTDVKRRSEREDSVLNHSRCFIITDLIWWWFVWIYLLILSIYVILNTFFAVISLILKLKTAGMSNAIYSQVHKYWDIDKILTFFWHHNGFQMKRTRCALTADCQL